MSCSRLDWLKSRTMPSFYAPFPKSLHIAGCVGRCRISPVPGTLLVMQVLICTNAMASGPNTGAEAKAGASAKSSEQAVAKFKDGRLSVSATNQPLAQVLNVISEKAINRWNW